LAGDPYLNFTISAVVELIAMFICDVTLTKFGRKIPYVLNMAIAGVALTSIMFIPTSKIFLLGCTQNLKLEII
jgi:Na+/melibiose symporter-like transporter